MIYEVDAHTKAGDGRKEPVSRPRRSMAQTIGALDRIAARCPGFIANRGASFKAGENVFTLPRYLFIGPKGGGEEVIRLALFAGIHGDEAEGVHALTQFVQLLESQPELGRGYCLFIYPVCNPTGFEDGTRNSRSGKDLNRQFWVGSREPEVRLLESELVAHALHGIISLHTDEGSDGFYGYAHGATFTRDLLEPALQAAEDFVPRNVNETIDGFPARNGIIKDRFEGSLCAPPQVRPRPFEIILETPPGPPAYLKEAAFVAALRKILIGYRELIAFAPNL